MSPAATTTVILQDGFKLGEKVLKKAVVREPNPADYLGAVADSERPVATPAGWFLMTSNPLVGAHMLRRQIVSIDDHQGPLTLAELTSLSQRDFDKLGEVAGSFDKAISQEIETRGRD